MQDDAQPDGLLDLVEGRDAQPVPAFEIDTEAPEQLIPATPQQVRYVERLAYHGRKRQAAVEAGFKPGTPIAKIEQGLSQTSIVRAIEKAGISDDLLAGHIFQGLEAQKNFRTGVESYEKEPDWTNRHRFLETALMLKGYGDRAAKNQTPNVAVTFNMQHILVGAFKIMGRSAGIEIDEEKLAQEIGAMSAPFDPFAPMERQTAQEVGEPEES